MIKVADDHNQNNIHPNSHKNHNLFIKHILTMYINLLNHRSFLKAAAAVAITAVPFSASVYAANNDDESSSRSFLFFKKKNKHTAQPDTTSSSTKEKYDDFHSGDAVVSDGIFKVIKKGADYYFEIPRSVLGRDMLVVNKFTRVPLELNSAGCKPWHKLCQPDDTLRT